MSAGLLAVLALTACDGAPDAAPAAPAPTTVPPSFAARLDLDGPGPSEPRQALSLVPAEAGTVVLTDYRDLRSTLGAEGLTSESLMTDRTAFWERAGREAVMLTEGLLRQADSRLWLDYDFSSDDVAWEVRFTGPDGPGFVLALRPDLDLAGVRAAIEADVAPLGDAQLLAEEHLLVSGVAANDEPVWRDEPVWATLVEDDAEATYLRRGCIPLDEALGPDATVEEQEPIEPAIAGLDPLEGFSVGFRGELAIAWLGPDRIDLHRRADLPALWPDRVGFDEAFTGDQVADPATGRIGLQIGDPQAAARLTLTGELPFAVCDEFVPLPSPSGL